MDHYRAPFKLPASHEPVWRWPNELPINGERADIHAIPQAYDKWLMQVEMPKLLFWAIPGSLISGSLAQSYAAKLKNVRSVGIGLKRHDVQEGNLRLMGREIAGWSDGLQ